MPGRILLCWHWGILFLIPGLEALGTTMLIAATGGDDVGVLVSGALVTEAGTYEQLQEQAIISIIGDIIVIT